MNIVHIQPLNKRYALPVQNSPPSPRQYGLPAFWSKVHLLSRKSGKRENNPNISCCRDPFSTNEPKAQFAGQCSASVAKGEVA